MIKIIDDAIRFQVVLDLVDALCVADTADGQSHLLDLLEDMGDLGAHLTDIEAGLVQKGQFFANWLQGFLGYRKVC